MGEDTAEVMIGRRIRAWRRARGWTQAHLGERVGFGRTSITNIEAGRQGLTVAAMLDIARALGFREFRLMVPRGTCPEREEAMSLKGQPIGMYHCTHCGAMILAGVDPTPACPRTSRRLDAAGAGV